MSAIKERYSLVDQIRGFAVVLMIIFHFFYDLNVLRYIQIDMKRNPFWKGFPLVIVFLFFLCAGMSLCLAHEKKIKWGPFCNRWGKIVICSGIVSAATYIFFPGRWIYFGTLHCIALGSLLTLPFLRRPWTAFFIGLALFIPSLIWQKNLPWFKLSHPSMDYISLFPWWGAFLWGVFAFHKGLHKYHLPDCPPTRGLSLLGVFSLRIYLLHQPVLFGCLYMIQRL